MNKITWYGLWKKIGKQSIGKMMNSYVYAVIDDMDIPLTIKFKPNGDPYLVKNDLRVKPHE